MEKTEKEIKAEIIIDAYNFIENYHGTTDAENLYKHLLLYNNMKDEDVVDKCARCGNSKNFIDTICGECERIIRTELNED